jgi:integral membrane protein (TIGR01906 family)
VALVAGIALATVVVLVVNGFRLVAGEWLVRFEYGRDGFPPDRYGLAAGERTALALVGLESILPGSEGTALLERATLPDGTAAFDRRQIEHMADVRRLLGAALRLQLLLAVALGALALGLRRTRLRAAVPAGLLAGALGTVAVAVVAVPFVLLGFDGLFTRFHEVFFDGDSWRFARTDTLLRLYPDRFWEDTAQLIAALTLAQAAVLGPLAWLWLRRVRRGGSP